MRLLGRGSKRSPRRVALAWRPPKPCWRIAVMLLWRLSPSPKPTTPVLARAQTVDGSPWYVPSFCLISWIRFYLRFKGCKCEIKDSLRKPLTQIGNERRTRQKKAYNIPLARWDSLPTQQRVESWALTDGSGRIPRGVDNCGIRSFPRWKANWMFVGLSQIQFTVSHDISAL